jgi:hypothetical protein
VDPRGLYFPSRAARLLHAGEPGTRRSRGDVGPHTTVTRVRIVEREREALGPDGTPANTEQTAKF